MDLVCVDFNPGFFTGLSYVPNWPIFGGAVIQPDGQLILGGLFGLKGFPNWAAPAWRENLVRIPAFSQDLTGNRKLEIGNCWTWPQPSRILPDQ